MNRLLQNRIVFDDDDGAGGGDPAGESSQEQGGGTAATGADKAFGQADLNRAAGEARREGREAALKTVADDLGVSIDEAKTLIRQARDREESEKTEAQKAIDKANAESQKASEREAAAALREHTANVRDALRDEGVTRDRLAAVGKLVEVDVGADEEAITTAIEAVKKDFPELFGAKPGGAPSSDTGGAPAGGGGTGGEDAMERGRKRAQAKQQAAEYPILQQVK